MGVRAGMQRILAKLTQQLASSNKVSDRQIEGGTILNARTFQVIHGINQRMRREKK